MRTCFDHNGLTASLARWVSHVSYPCTCPVCGTVMENTARAWCNACDPRVVCLNDPLCPVCHRFLPSPGAECPSSHPAHSPATLIALGLFDHAWRAVVHALKYHGHKGLVDPLGERLAVFVTRFPEADAIVAIPTDPRKIAERGFGHAELLAATSATKAEIAFIPGALKRTRRITDQTRLTGKQRAQNLKGAFTVPDAAAVTEKTIIVIDDVTTTGATVREAARALTVAGAKSVMAAVIAANFGNLRDGR